MTFRFIEFILLTKIYIICVFSIEMQEINLRKESIVTQDIQPAPFYHQQQSQQPQPQPDPDSPKVIIFKIIIVVLALVCLIMCIFVMAKSSQYFSYLFSVGTNQILSKNYLSLYYKPYLASLYISIMGFVVVVADTVIFFCKFTQKDKMVYFHLCYFLCIFVSGIVALTNYDYLDRMTLLEVGTGAVCTANGYLDECLLAGSFISYRGNFMTFYIVFILFFLIYTLVYHFAVLKVLPRERGKVEQHSLVRQNTQNMSIENANNKNMTLVSEPGQMPDMA